MYPLICFLLVLASAALYVKRQVLLSWSKQRRGDGLAQADEKAINAFGCPMNRDGAMPAFDWRTTEPMTIRPFKPTYNMMMSLRPTTPEELIVMDKNYTERVLNRKAIIAARPEVVTGCTPVGKGAVDELYTFLLGTYLPARFPTMFSLSRDRKTFENLVLGDKWPVVAPADANEALRIIGQTVEDDMFLLYQTDEGHRSIAFVCCHPSGFDPSSKLDKLLVQIHEPVPGYDKIKLSMERTFGRLQVGKPARRMNWTVADSPTLFDCGQNHIHADKVIDSDIDQDINLEKARLRCELQTLTRLPQTKAVLFSFKTHLYTLAQVKEEGLGPELAEAIDGLKNGNAPVMWVYKGAVRWAKSVQEYLRT